MLRFNGASFDLPIGFLALHIGEYGEVEWWWRGRRRPFQRAAVPRIADHIPQLVSIANADNELRDLTNRAGQQDQHTYGGHQHPRIPRRHIVMLHSASHTEQTGRVKRDEGNIEAYQPTPERGLAP